MATVICLAGFGDDPQMVFSELRDVLRGEGHNVIVLDPSCVLTHEERVTLVLDAYEVVSGSEEVCFIGQSAGGSAVRIAAERLSELGKPLGGVILLSPAMPRWISYVTWTSCKIIFWRLMDLLCGRRIVIREDEYVKLVSPVAFNRKQVVAARTPMSGVEGRTLAFLPPSFKGYSYPTLLMFGSEDKWINPKAQNVLAQRYRKIGSEITVRSVPECGHHVLYSPAREEIMSAICSWIQGLL